MMKALNWGLLVNCGDEHNGQAYSWKDKVILYEGVKSPYDNHRRGTLSLVGRTMLAKVRTITKIIA